MHRYLCFKKFLNKFLIINLVFILLHITFIFDTQNQILSNEIEKVREIEEKIKKLKDYREKLNKEILETRQQQKTLAQEKSLIEQQIMQNKVQIELLELEIEKIKIDLNFVTDQKNKVELRLRELEVILAKTELNLKQSLNFLYKVSISSNGILNSDYSFESNLLSNEKERSLIRLIKSKLLEVKSLTNELNVKKHEILLKENELKELKATLDAKLDSLDMQRQALAWQNNNKDLLINKNIQKEKELTNKANEYSREIIQLELRKAELFNQIANLQSHANAFFVEAGQVIGFQGRSGLSCDWYDPNLEPVKTNNWCEIYGGTSSMFYYYDPVKFPTKGSHLHFEYRVRGVVVDPGPHIFNAGDSQKSHFKNPPLTQFVVSRGLNFSIKHFGYDLVSYHKAPVYAVKSGYISYYCLNYPNIPNFPDPTYFAIIRHVDSEGYFDGTVSSYLHLDRGGRPCTFAPIKY